jgi:hypothetical protein
MIRRIDVIPFGCNPKMIWCGAACHVRAMRVNHCAMMRFFDMDDHARMPWRFYGATVSVLARS